MMNIRFHRLAVAEIDHEVDYYESRQTGLGTELENEIDTLLDLICSFPEAAPQRRRRHATHCCARPFPIHATVSDSR